MRLMGLRGAVFVEAAALAVLTASTAAPQSPREEADARESLGVRAWEQGRPDVALEHLQRSLQLRRQIRDRRGQAAALSNIAGIYRDVGSLDSAMVYLRLALSIANEVRYDSATARTLGGIAATQSELGRPDSALTYYRLATPVARRARDHDGEAMILHNIGDVYAGLGRTDSALFYLRSALTRFEESRGRSASRGAAMTLASIGAAHLQLNQRDSAVSYLKRAVSIRENLGDVRGQATTLHNLSVAYKESGHSDSARAALEAALDLHRSVGNRAGEAATLASMGLLENSNDEYAGAVLYLGRALEIAREVGDSAQVARTLQWIAAAKRRAGVLEGAVAYYDSAATMYARLRRHIGSDANVISYGEEEEFAYWPWADALMQLDEPIKAFAVAERGRAQAILSLMLRRADASPALAFGAPSAAETDLEREAVEIWRSVRGTGAHVLYYLQAGDTLIIWALSPSGRLPYSRRAARADSVASLIAAFRAGVGADSARGAMTRGHTEQELTRSGAASTQASGDSEAALTALSALLLPTELTDSLPRAGEVVIVPHGVLGLVPFAALRIGGDTIPLGSRYALRYAPSLRALAAAEARPPPPYTAPVVVVGDPDMPTVPDANGNAAKLRALPGAREEGRWLAQRLHAQPLTGADATESMLRRVLPSARLIHLATHGLAFGSDSRVRYSYVALAPDANHDGLLTLGEIMDDDAITLSADLVVLSACQTGLGDLKQAEGTVGLQRGLLAKGARSVLVSLWSVDDAATAFLMSRFYEHWLGGSSKSESLRRAQNEVRNQPKWNHPRYWAAFQLVGAR